MTVKELIIKLLEHPTDYVVCSPTKDEVTFGVLEPDGSAVYLLTLDGKADLQGK